MYTFICFNNKNFFHLLFSTIKFHDIPNTNLFLDLLGDIGSSVVEQRSIGHQATFQSLNTISTFTCTTL